MTETTTKKTEVASVVLKGGTQRRNGIEKLRERKGGYRNDWRKKIAQDKEKREKEELERQKKEKREKGKISWKKVSTERINNWWWVKLKHNCLWMKKNSNVEVNGNLAAVSKN